MQSATIYTGIEGADLSNNAGKEKGVRVDSVKAGSAAARVGLKKRRPDSWRQPAAGDQLRELRKILDTKPPVLALNVQRGDTSLYLLMQ